MSEVFPRLFSSTKLECNTLNNRIAIAPLTRQIAEPGPKKSMREEYHDTCRR
jgi:2,4-dienoyl-CoA reductase-like NADH-dependent reductase (Old Yellow Enzyme family)